MSRTFSAKSWLTLMAFVITSSACGKIPNSTGAAEISYHLERSATNDGENAILLDYPDDSNYYVRITGDNVKTSIPLGVLRKAPKRINIQSEAIGTYSVDIIIALGDQTEIIKDTLKWDYDHKLPPDPIVSSQTPASRDENAILLVSSSRGPSVDEMWVGGDVALPQWLPIPKSGKVPIILSNGDGEKKLSLKLRNAAGSESSSQELIITRKSVGPKKCKVQPIAATINGNSLRLQVSAENDGPLAFRVLGEVAKINPFRTFIDKIETEIALSPGPGDKKLVVYLRDEAENYCDEIPLTVRVDPNYRSERIELKEIWTDNSIVTAQLSLDTFEDHAIEMFISGGVEPGPMTFQWLPFSSSVNLELSPIDGNRFVTVQIRDNDRLREAVSTAVFLRPSVFLGGSGAVRILGLSDMLGMEHITITGCSETYLAIAYASALPCTVGSGPVEATYHLVDGTDVTRSANP